jgi:hypothetical protein
LGVSAFDSQRTCRLSAARVGTIVIDAMKIGQRQIAIAALAIGSFAAGYCVSFLRFDSREADEAYINYMSQCVFLGDKEQQCAEEWRLMDSQERFFYSESGQRIASQFERKRRKDEERAKAECEVQGRKDASCEIEQFMKAKKKID